MTKVTKTRRLWFALVLAAFLIAGYVFVLYGYGQNAGFKTYEPTNLPPNLKVAYSELHIVRRGSILPRFDKHVNVVLNHPDSWIEESASGSHINTASSLVGVDKTSYSANHQAYYVVQVADSSGRLVQELAFSKGGTDIWMTIRDYPKLTDKQWSDLIDSFQLIKLDSRVFRNNYQA